MNSKYHYILIFILCTCFINIPYSSKAENSSPFKYSGAVLAHIHDIRYGYGSESSKLMHNHLNTIGFNSVQINTFAYMRDIKQPEVLYGFDPSLKPEYIEREIKNLHNAGFTVMLKPHVWIGGSEFDPNNWRNKIDYADEGDVRKWFESYGKFIVQQAEIANNSGAEIFVIGTELVGMSKYDKEWQKLINKVRDVYKGKITYAAEGLNAKKIKFWKDLDYIGIDAYFKLTDKKIPGLNDILAGWEKYEKEIKSLSMEYDRKIIFTEIGYKSVEGTTIRPWEWNQDYKTDQKQQANAYDAFLKTFSDKQYFEGFFVWKYFTSNESYERGNMKNGFTPYNKLAEGVIKNWLN